MERYLILVTQTDTYLNAGVALGQVGIRAGACWAQLGLQVGARPRLTEIYQEKLYLASFTLCPEIREVFGKVSALLPISEENQKFGRRWELCSPSSSLEFFCHHHADFLFAQFLQRRICLLLFCISRQYLHTP